MKIAIVEDDLIQRENLKKYINQYAKLNGISITVDCFPDGINIVDQYSSNYDVIYFDIEMEHMDGMTAAKKIRKVDQTVIIVFVTNYVQFAIDGYSVSATDFIMKPVNDFSFTEHFKKIIKLFENQDLPTISIKTKNGIRKIQVEDIDYVESEGNMIHFYTNHGLYTTRKSMKELEKDLEPHHFYRCNNGYLVNLKKVRGIDNNQVVVGETRLPISRPRKKEFLNVLTNYLGEY